LQCRSAPVPGVTRVEHVATHATNQMVRGIVLTDQLGSNDVVLALASPLSQHNAHRLRDVGQTLSLRLPSRHW
jgi:hypothetical protein